MRWKELQRLDPIRNEIEPFYDEESKKKRRKRSGPENPVTGRRNSVKTKKKRNVLVERDDSMAAKKKINSVTLITIDKKVSLKTGGQLLVGFIFERKTSFIPR